ncbi:hypothetical protein AC1031_012255 [Aphanomyces cochlioides]|nr:hypothetical protein AC1031_012255 [Aphanomyces cochlioides]
MLHEEIEKLNFFSSFSNSVVHRDVDPDGDNTNTLNGDHTGAFDGDACCDYDIDNDGGLLGRQCATINGVTADCHTCEPDIRGSSATSGNQNDTSNGSNGTSSMDIIIETPVLLSDVSNDSNTVDTSAFSNGVSNGDFDCGSSGAINSVSSARTSGETPVLLSDVSNDSNTVDTSAFSNVVSNGDFDSGSSGAINSVSSARTSGEIDDGRVNVDDTLHLRNVEAMAKQISETCDKLKAFCHRQTVNPDVLKTLQGLLQPVENYLSQAGGIDKQRKRRRTNKDIQSMLRTYETN